MVYQFEKGVPHPLSILNCYGDAQEGKVVGVEGCGEGVNLIEQFI